MTYVITKGCCGDGACVDVCPVQCIRPRPGDPDFLSAEQLYVDPAVCIDCGACMDACPVDAATDESLLPAHLHDYLDINAEYFAGRQPADNLIVTPPLRRLPAERPALRVAVVGAGPAACYAVEALTDIKGVSVSLFERLPVPFGLARSGVAPDHPDTRLIGRRFAAVLERSGVACYFNVEVGRDVTVADLLGRHHAVIVAAGAGGDRALGIPGEDLPGVHPAREFTAWYNGHPEHAGHGFGLAGERAVVIGNGNVALDVARTLARPAGDFATTDIADHALAALRDSAVREVVVVGRRGPEHAAFSTGELMELARLEGVDLLADPAARDAGGTASRWRRDTLSAAAGRRPAAGNRRVVLRFGLTPVSVNGDGHVSSVTFARADGGTETIETSLVLRAVGYRALPLPGLPCDPATGRLSHEAGRVLDPATGGRAEGVYCAGWIKRGPSGGIGANRVDATETVESLLADFAAGRLPDPAGNAEDLASFVAARQPAVVDRRAWQRIERAEAERGRLAGRPRVKFTGLDELLTAARVPPGEPASPDPR